MSDPDLTDADRAEVLAAVTDYDEGLASGAADRAAGWFSSSATRLGPEGHHAGLTELQDLRASTPATGPSTVRWHDLRSLGPGLAAHLVELARGGRLVRRTQIWRNEADGWRIVHAHVSHHDDPEEPR